MSNQHFVPEHYQHAAHAFIQRVYGAMPSAYKLHHVIRIKQDANTLLKGLLSFDGTSQLSDQLWLLDNDLDLIFYR